MAVPHFVIMNKEDCKKIKPTKLTQVYLGIKDTNGKVSPIKNDALPLASVKTAGHLKEVLFNYLQTFNANVKRMGDEKEADMKKMDKTVFQEEGKEQLIYVQRCLMELR